MTLQEKLQAEEKNYLFLTHRKVALEDHIVEVEKELQRAAGKIALLQELIEENDA